MTIFPYVSNFVYAQGIEGVRVPLKGKGAPLKEWYSILFNNLKKLGDTDTLPSLAQDTFGAEERWRRGQKYKDEPVEQCQNFWAGMNNQLEKERCPRCLSAVTKGLLICPFCKAEYALIQGFFAKCPPENDADQAWRILVAGTTAPIWVPTAEGDEMGHGSSQIPKQEQGKEETSTPQQQSSSCGPGKSEPAPPLKAQKQPNFWSVVRQEITAVLENNKPRIDRMSATSVEELEAIRFFENPSSSARRSTSTGSASGTWDEASWEEQPWSRTSDTWTPARGDQWEPTSGTRWSESTQWDNPKGKGPQHPKGQGGSKGNKGTYKGSKK